LNGKWAWHNEKQYTVLSRRLSPMSLSSTNGVYPHAAPLAPPVNSKGYISLISQGKFKEALEVVRRTLPIAVVYGRICTHACERECERGKVDEAIAIRQLKRFATDKDGTGGVR